jgi:DNA modification methylase
MNTENLFGSQTGEESDEQSSKRLGPPNRMNDLVYRDWMKFQKSFFRFGGLDALVQETILFFTKEKWSDGRLSSTLLLGFDKTEIPESLGKRVLDRKASANVREAASCLQAISSAQTYDFVMVNLRELRERELEEGFADLQGLFRELRRIVRPNAYCCIVCEYPNDSVFPLAWSVAQAGRGFLKLRDERIGLVKDCGDCVYCLHFQAEDDRFQSIRWMPTDTQLTNHKEKAITPWVMPKSPPRKSDEVFHPAKFPESLVMEFIRAFTKEGDTVLDPMVGTGSAVVAATRAGRHGIGIDLNSTFAGIAQNRVKAENQSLLLENTQADIHVADAREVHRIVSKGSVEYCITSPPYWSMLSNVGSENQKARRDKNLPMVYSADTRDVGNVESYDEFLALLTGIYESVAEVLRVDGHLTVIVKNVKREHVIYPLAWDLVRHLARKGGLYEFAGATLWCQDDVSLKPFAVGIHWVSNTLHTYCLHFRRC